MDNNQLWNDFLSTIKQKVSLFSYKCYIQDLKLHSYNNNEVILIVPNNEQLMQTLIKNFQTTIEDIFNDLTNNTIEIKYIFERDLDKVSTPKKETLAKKEEIIEDDTTNEYNELSNYKYSSNFNPKYTFDTFVVAKSNQLAYGTALPVAQNPGKLYNPYFIYAKSGLGKTHLMHAIGNYIVEHSDKRVLYVSAEQFVNDYVSIVTTKTKDGVSYLEAFRNKYRNVDVLMIDDIQFLEKANKSQMEFTNTFNTLHASDKQIIIASDRSINDYKLLEERLKTRFRWGLTESINPPEFELKKNIIINKIRLNDFDLDLDLDIIEYIANNCGTDIRNLENSVLRLVAYKATFNIEKLTIEIAQDALEEFVTETVYKTNSISKIIDIVAKYYNLDSTMIKGKMRKKEIANARAIAMYLSCFMTKESLERIGLEMGGKDHSTIIHSRDKITEELKSNKKLQEEIKILKEKICE